MVLPMHHRSSALLLAANAMQPYLHYIPIYTAPIACFAWLLYSRTVSQAHRYMHCNAPFLYLYFAITSFNRRVLTCGLLLCLHVQQLEKRGIGFLYYKYSPVHTALAKGNGAV